MGPIGEFLKRLFARKREGTAEDAEGIRLAFRDRYHSFKLLLTANHRALEGMAELDEALRGTRPFGLGYVRARCTAIATQVWQMIRHLNDLAPGRYERLHDRFGEIRRRITPCFSRAEEPAGGEPVLRMDRVDREHTGQVGGKMATLGDLRNRLGLAVPDGFVVTARGYRMFMEHRDLQADIDRLLGRAEVDRLEDLFRVSGEIRQAILGADLPADLESAIREHYREVEAAAGEGVRMAVRSSALGEDLAGASSAGQYHSELNVPQESLLHAYKQVVASKYGVPAMVYRMHRGIPDEDVAMCVGYLRMVDAVAGGVAYSRNPLEARDDSVFIYSAWGLPKPVVDGRSATDLFVLDRTTPPGIRHREIPEKETKFVCDRDRGIRRLDLNGSESGLPSLSDRRVIELATLAVRLETHLGAPQDIEWAVGPDGAIIVLQSRPLRQQATGNDVSGRPSEAVEPGPVLLRGGVTASPGAAAGPVFVVEKDLDAVQSLPRWASLLGRAAAVVTEHGTGAGHLATVSREFGIPALFGLPGAVGRLRRGREITVDADGRCVYEGRIEALLGRRREPTSLMEGSPVFEALKGAARHISPLNLLDPDAPDFTAERCETFHDITRFCHEKAVDEMFRFGKDHRFPERSSKQLHCEVPMQWWVLNLDDGFKEEVGGKYVKLESIVSVPMRALWEGITAVPWEGPPPPDGRGFLSVMFEATRNPALTPGLRSRYVDRNYFMISKDYCSLSSRLGAHFSIVEALVSERTRENYVSFQFKGGAADRRRRIQRVVFVREILETYGFRVEVNEDHMIARLEGREAEFMKERLRILGYLTLHTRQIDMVMAREARVSYYRTKFHRDIETILARH
jgi:pyruvate,water dikinase